MLNFVFIKGFGDFIIGAYFLKSLSQDDTIKIRILTTPRIAVLAAELRLPINLSILDLPGMDAPALFEVRRKGLFQAMKSGIEIKKAIGNLNTQNPISGKLIFDKVSFREKYISTGHKIIGLPKNNDNIYQAYNKLMNQLHLKTRMRNDRPSILNETNSEFIGIFPTSRAEEKDIPPSVLHKLNQLFQREGNRLKIYLFPDQLERYKEVKNITAIPKDFSSLIEHIRAHQVIISADSLPAHLAQYFSIPVFVLTPKNNHYWLPIESFNKASYCNFDDILTLTQSSIDKLLMFSNGA
jgi:ADP-heptose:LPS heptosyltransferase